MVNIRLPRDEARFIKDHFFPFIVEKCRLKIRDALIDKDNDARMVGRMMHDLTLSLEIKFKKKLLTQANTFTIKSTDAEAICFYQLMMNFPIAPGEVYMINLRRQVTDFLYKQLFY
jgi:hypothetical protein